MEIKYKYKIEEKYYFAGEYKLALIIKYKLSNKLFYQKQIIYLDKDFVLKNIGILCKNKEDVYERIYKLFCYESINDYVKSYIKSSIEKENIKKEETNEEKLANKLKIDWHTNKMHIE